MRKFFNHVFCIFVVSGLLLSLSGCGGGGGSSAGTTGIVNNATIISGVIADGLVSGARVWIDLNSNGLFDGQEPSALSNEEGQYSISFDKEVPAGVKLLGEGGIDQDTNQSFVGRLEARLRDGVQYKGQKTQMLSPLVTLKSQGLAEVELRQLFPDLPVGDLDEIHPTHEAGIHKANVTVHTLAKQLASTRGIDLSHDLVAEVYQTLSSQLPSHQGTVGELPLRELVARFSSHGPIKCESMARVMESSLEKLQSVDGDKERLKKVQGITQIALAQGLRGLANDEQDVESWVFELESANLEEFLDQGGLILAHGGHDFSGHFPPPHIGSNNSDRFDAGGGFGLSANHPDSFIDAGNGGSVNPFSQGGVSALSNDNQECGVELFLKPSELASELVEVQGASLNVYCQGDYMIVQSNGIPTFDVVPMTPNSLREQSRKYYIPVNPQYSEETTEIPFLGPIGVTITGLPIYAPNEAADLGYGDAKLDGIVDECGGHVGPNGDYHFHARPGCPFDQAQELTSTVLGYAFDGFPIMAPFVCANEDCSELRKVEGSWQKCEGDQCSSVSLKELQSSWEMIDVNERATWDAHSYVQGSGDLDECNGMMGSDGQYRYYATDSFPYNLGCYHGVVDSRVNRLMPGWSEKDSVDTRMPGGQGPQGREGSGFGGGFNQSAQGGGFFPGPQGANGPGQSSSFQGGFGGGLNQSGQGGKSFPAGPGQGSSFSGGSGGSGKGFEGNFGQPGGSFGSGGSGFDPQGHGFPPPRRSMGRIGFPPPHHHHRRGEGFQDWQD